MTNLILEEAVHASFPPALDNTMVSAFRACPKKFFWRHIEHLQRGETSIHLVSGGAFAKGLEVTRKCYFDHGMDFETSLAKGAAALIFAYNTTDPIPKYAAKSVWGMVGALAYYFEVWPINRIIQPYRPAEGQKHTIEWNFAIPIPGCFHPDTGKPLLYCGRFDMVGLHENSVLLGEDDKTTSQLGDQWFNRWRIPNQILGYMWGAREFGMNLGGFNVRGVSLLKNGYNHAETMMLINEWQIERFLFNLKRTVNRMIEVYTHFKQSEGHRNASGVFEMNMDSACSAYGGCDFLNLCEAHDPEPFIEPNYVKIIWNPLASRD